jgi:tRNA U38,U39,U40 pseudouridine synthase TruA
MAELTIKCDDIDSVKLLVETAVTRQLKQLDDGIWETEEQLKAFEVKYQMSTKEFLYRFEETDELQHRIDMEFDEWVGYSRMLESLHQEANSLRGIQFAN